MKQTQKSSPLPQNHLGREWKLAWLYVVLLFKVLRLFCKSIKRIEQKEQPTWFDTRSLLGAVVPSEDCGSNEGVRCWWEKSGEQFVKLYKVSWTTNVASAICKKQRLSSFNREIDLPPIRWSSLSISTKKWASNWHPLPIMYVRWSL